MAFWNGKIWYRWNLKELSSPNFQSNSIILQIENEILQKKYILTDKITWLFIGTIFGAIISIFISIGTKKIWEFLQKPILNLNITAIVDNEPTIHIEYNIAFYHIDVHNTGKTTAISCDINLTFRDENKNFLFKLPGKWDRSPEPLGPIQPGGGTQIWPSLSAIGGLVNIRPNIPERFCIVIKGNEEACYAFNSDSYFYAFRNPKWILEQGRFFVDVEVRGGNAYVKSTFLIENQGNTNQDISITKIHVRDN